MDQERMEQAARWVRTLFEPDDVIELRAIKPGDRPIRNWGDRETFVADILPRADALNAQGYNIYAGVCPRSHVGGGKAEDVQTARTLWLDFDHMDEATAAEKARALPTPTMSVNSGHGIHLFWKLDKPTEHLDNVEQLLRDMATLTGADEKATDRARILRVPGYMNHKDPVAPSTLLDADPDVTYSPSDVRAVVPAASPKPEPVVQPTSPNKHTTGTGLSAYDRARRWMDKRDPAVEGAGGDEWTFKTACALVRGFKLPDNAALELLAEWNNTCQPPWKYSDLKTKIGSAKRNGKEPFGYLLDKPLEKGPQNGPGRSPESHARNGHDYGDSGIHREDRRHRPDESDEIREGTVGPDRVPPVTDQDPVAEDGTGPEQELINHRTEWHEDDRGNPQPRHFAIHLNAICQQMQTDLSHDMGRLGDNLFYARPEVDNIGQSVAFIPDADSLFGLFKSRYDTVRWKTGGADRNGVSFVTRGEMFAQTRDRTEAYLGISSYPYFPPQDQVFTRWNAPDGYEANGEYFNRFLQFFNPATDRDADLLQALALTLFWGGPAGTRPLFIIAPKEEGGAEQSIGKSELARQFARLVGGAMELKLPRRGSFADGLQKQALEEINLHMRVALIDNVTGTIRDDSLTDIVTCKLIEGRASFAKQAKRANLITWMITTNEPTFSADIASRAVLIRLDPCDRQARPFWLHEINDFLNQYAAHVAVDALWALEHAERHPVTTKHSRFPLWDQAVLSRISTVNECLDHIRETHQQTNSDAIEIMEFLISLKDRYPTARELRTADLCEVWKDELGKEFSTAQMGRILKSASARGALPGITKKWEKKAGSPWLWNPWEITDREGREGQQASGEEKRALSALSDDDF